MEAASIARKQKLQLLRKRRDDEQAGLVPKDGGGGQDEEVSLLVKRSFRNYDPTTGQAKRFKGPRDLEDTVEKVMEGVQERILAEDDSKRKEELDLTNIAPKRPNWDLKRDMEKRLQKLKRRDKEAILLLIRQRINSQQKASNGAEVSIEEKDSIREDTARLVASANVDLEVDQLSEEEEEEEEEEED
ncbi:hypothetical protein IE53DRAFT_412820 [Violaceomyces palustris]|uniref:Uncharacterized protein n=1 Tax=Violaceomyces palustris TaxID=1673888 RepID=A0ACD0NPM4_9BASI|nr:hypothetical protein IE53DRAFT_412820 [Violaceomyces palustris]